MSMKRDATVLDEETMKGLLLLRKSQLMTKSTTPPLSEVHAVVSDSTMFLLKAKCGTKLNEAFPDSSMVAFAAASSENVDITLVDKFSETEWIFKCLHTPSVEKFLFRGQFRAMGYDLLVTPHLPFL
jgi:hypothetical protein